MAVSPLSESAGFASKEIANFLSFFLSYCLFVFLGDFFFSSLCSQQEAKQYMYQDRIMSLKDRGRCF